MSYTSVSASGRHDSCLQSSCCQYHRYVVTYCQHISNSRSQRERDKGGRGWRICCTSAADAPDVEALRPMPLTSGFGVADKREACWLSHEEPLLQSVFTVKVSAKSADHLHRRLRHQPHHPRAVGCLCSISSRRQPCSWSWSWGWRARRFWPTCC